MISHAELKRRHALMREAMAEAGHDIWLIAGHEAGGLKGYIRYVADWRLTDGLVYVIFPLEGEPSMVMNFGSMAYWARENAQIRDIRTGLDKVAEVVKALKEHGGAEANIGVVGWEDIIPYTHGKALMTELSGANWSDATEMMDRTMIPSTPEELAGAEEIHHLLVRVMERLSTAMVPGRTELEAMAEGVHEMEVLGCVDGACRLSTVDVGSNRPATERRFEPDDIIRIYLESAGPSGYWAELGGVFSFREPSELFRRKFNTVVKAMDRVASMMRPGVRAGELSLAAEEVYREDGWKIIGRSIWDAHGQGLRKHLPPHAWPGSEEILQPNMILNQHPGVQTEDRLGFSLTNNYVVTPEGGRAMGGYKHRWNVLNV